MPRSQKRLSPTTERRNDLSSNSNSTNTGGAPAASTSIVCPPPPNPSGSNATALAFLATVATANHEKTDASRVQNHPDTGDDGESEAPSDNERPMSIDDANLVIPKPVGEVGRPGRGGYNIDVKLAELGMKDKEILGIRVRLSYSLGMFLLILLLGNST